MTILSMILMASTMISALSTGETLPPLKGEFLTGRAAQLPDAASGHVVLEFEVTGKANGAEQMNSMCTQTHYFDWSSSGLKRNLLSVNL